MFQFVPSSTEDTAHKKISHLQRSSAATLNSESSRSAVDGVAEKSRGNRSALPRAGLSAPLRIAAHYNIAERQGTKTMRDGRDGRPRVHQRPSVSARICSACVHAQVASGPLAKHVQPVISGFPRRVRARSVIERAPRPGAFCICRMKRHIFASRRCTRGHRRLLSSDPGVSRFRGSRVRSGEPSSLYSGLYS